MSKSNKLSPAEKYKMQYAKVSPVSQPARPVKAVAVPVATLAPPRKQELPPPPCEDEDEDDDDISQDDIAAVYKSLDEHVPFDERVEQFCQRLGWPCPQHLGGGVMAMMVEVTPFQALEIMTNHHIENNRGKKPKKIASYISDMKHDRWEFSHQGMAFNGNLKLYDGQNRCMACMESEAPFYTMVVFMPPERSALSMPVTDTGVPRTYKDSAKIGGRNVSTRWPSVVRCIANGITAEAMSHSSLTECGHILQAAVDFTFECFHSNLPRITSKGMLGAFGRASYHVPHDVLLAFAECVNAGIGKQDGDQAAIMLTRFLTTRNHYGGEAASIVYRKTENAIWHFWKRIPIDRLHEASKELFPLPPHIQKAINEVK